MGYLLNHAFHRQLIVKGRFFNYPFICGAMLVKTTPGYAKRMPNKYERRSARLPADNNGKQDESQQDHTNSNGFHHPSKSV